MQNRWKNVAALSLLLAVAATAMTPVPASAANVSFTLYGHNVSGWGLSNASIDDPGPSLQVDQGDNVTITVVLNDSQPHTWFIDYDNDSVADTGEPISPTANVGNPVRSFTFVADRAGTFTYRCSFHPGTMRGTIVVQATGGTPPADNTLLIAGGVIVVVVIIAAAALIMRGRPKPPVQPPTQP